jgi:hypothetical protein
MAAPTAWRRGLFQPNIVHLPKPGEKRWLMRRRGLWVRDTLCDRLMRADEPETEGAARCPDCAQLDKDRHNRQLPAAAGPAASAY